VETETQSPGPLLIAVDGFAQSGATEPIRPADSSVAYLRVIAAQDVDWIKLIDYFGERQRTNGTLTGGPLIDLYSRHTAGDRPPPGDHFLQPGRQAPYITAVIDTPERISAAFDIPPANTGSLPARPHLRCGLHQGATSWPRCRAQPGPDGRSPVADQLPFFVSRALGTTPWPRKSCRQAASAQAYD
jgi:hypothetical protein